MKKLIAAGFVVGVLLMLDELRRDNENMATMILDTNGELGDLETRQLKLSRQLDELATAMEGRGLAELDAIRQEHRP